MKELLVEMLKRKLREVDQMDIFDMIEDILKYLNKDDKKEYETTQEYVGFKYLFRACTMRDWKK